MTETKTRTITTNKESKTFTVTHAWTYDLKDAEKIKLDLIKQQSEMRMKADQLDEAVKQAESHAAEFEKLKRGGTNKWTIQQWLQMLSIVQSAAGKAQQVEALKNHQEALAQLAKDIAEIEGVQKELGA